MIVVRIESQKGVGSGTKPFKRTITYMEWNVRRELKQSGELKKVLLSSNIR